MLQIPIILASASPARLKLLARMNIHPLVMPANVDETEHKTELPYDVATRLAILKAEKIAAEIEAGYVIGADTVAAVGRRIMPKATTPKMVADCLKLYSGRRHKIYTGVHIIKKAHKIETRTRLVETIVRVKRFTEKEIEFYSQSGEGMDKAGGYPIQGMFQNFVPFIGGSFSNIIGLPLFETRNMLISLGLDSLIKR